MPVRYKSLQAQSDGLSVCFRFVYDIDLDTDSKHFGSVQPRYILNPILDQDQNERVGRYGYSMVLYYCTPDGIFLLCNDQRDRDSADLK